MTRDELCIFLNKSKQWSLTQKYWKRGNMCIDTYPIEYFDLRLKNISGLELDGTCVKLRYEDCYRDNNIIKCDSRLGLKVEIEL